MESTRKTRQRSRMDYDVEVRVRCGRCHRVLGRLYGDDREPYTFSDGRVQGVLPRGARIDYFRRHGDCRADWGVRWDKLVSAYARAAAHGDKGRRVIVIPTDL